MIKLSSLFPSTVFDKLKIKKIRDEFNHIVENPEVGFFDLPLAQKEALSLIERGKKWSMKRQHLFHIGTGGSSLGPEMLVSALLPHKKNITFINNIDPDDLDNRLKEHDPKDSLYFIVSKSGTTAETLATLAIIINLLSNKGIPESHFKEHLVFCTDPQKGDLRELAQKFQIECFDIPQNVGGRFSVLTSVGLFPFAFLGGDGKNLLEGANRARESILKENQLFELAQFLFDQSLEGKSQTVLMPYSSLLRGFSYWFVQLWAESLGKENKGLTPIPAYGTTDQHSQMQLFMQGPQDKVVIIIGIEEFKNEFSLKSNLHSKCLDELMPFSLNQLMMAERKGTINALSTMKKPNVEIEVEKLNTESLGALVFWMECLTVATSVCFKVDPFNQPGVELGKTNTWKILKKHN